MKPKRFNKKLYLNKETVTDLGNGEMIKLKGGGLCTDDDYTCFFGPTCFQTCECTPHPTYCVTACGSCPCVT